MAAPNAFSGHLEKWLFERTKSSIFFINMIPDVDRYGEIQGRMATAGHVPVGQRAALLNGDGHSGTGFVVENGPDHLKILTCAHLLEHVFTAEFPLSRHDANRLFHTNVLCDHYESSFRQPGQDIHPVRVYAPGEIIGISSRDDLMLIRVSRADVSDLDQICLRNHPHLTFSSTHPVAFDDCVMVSWPPLRHRTSVKEVKIGSEDGSSGAPLLNGSGNVIGMLHGGFGGFLSYLLSLNDIIYFLAHQGVVIRQD